jgi:hypothetical protein
MTAYRVNRGIAMLILSLNTGWRLVVTFKPQPIYAWDTIPVPIEQVRWTQSQAGQFWRAQKLLPQPEFELRSSSP